MSEPCSVCSASEPPLDAYLEGMSTSKTRHLDHARVVARDEFYTTDDACTKEFSHYDFTGMRVICPCDDPEHSRIYRWFRDRYHELGLAGLVACGYRADGTGADGRYDLFGGSARHGIIGRYDGRTERIGDMDGSGDMFASETVALMDHADIVVTNPPFSLFRALLTLTRLHSPHFLLLMPDAAMCYTQVTDMVRDGKARVGYSYSKRFYNPATGAVEHIAGAHWLTDLPVDRPAFVAHGDPDAVFDTYDGTDVIDVPRARLIPAGYTGLMGVPVTFLPFCDNTHWRLVSSPNLPGNIVPLLGGHPPFKRIFVQRVA